MDGEDKEAVKTGCRLDETSIRGLNAGASVEDKLETGVVAVVAFVMK